MRIKHLSAFMVCLFFAGLSIVNANQIAITEDGRKVVLNDDGTWEYMKETKTAKEEFHLRKVRWGMTRDHVLKSEVAELAYEDDDSLFYNATVRGLNCAIVYIFMENRLVRAKYEISEVHFNGLLHVDDYRTLQTGLTKKYGDPVSGDSIWHSDLYRDDPSNWGTAVGLGHLIYQSNWKSPETGIQLTLRACLKRLKKRK